MLTKIYVGNLGWNVSEKILCQLFSAFGQVSETRVMRDAVSGRTRGFGFVTFKNAADARAAIGGLQKRELDGRILTLGLAGGPDENTVSAPLKTLPAPKPGKRIRFMTRRN